VRDIGSAATRRAPTALVPDCSVEALQEIVQPEFEQHRGNIGQFDLQQRFPAGRSHLRSYGVQRLKKKPLSINRLWA